MKFIQMPKDPKKYKIALKEYASKGDLFLLQGQVIDINSRLTTLEKKVDDLTIEFRDFKKEMRVFKKEMRVFKDEMIRAISSQMKNTPNKYDFVSNKEFISLRKQTQLNQDMLVGIYQEMNSPEKALRDKQIDQMFEDMQDIKKALNIKPRKA